jgi:hypothetical protein
MRARGTTVLAVSALAAAARAASAQPFAVEPDWQPLLCGGGPMSDGLADEPDAIAERDLVGDDQQPAGLRAVDEDYFYLRLRVEAEPLVGELLRPFAWGMAFDLDLDRRTYEVLILADGIDGEVKLFENTMVTSPNNPAEPADLPPLAAYNYVEAGRVVDADSDFGGTVDWFVDIAVPWDDLAQVDLEPDTPFYAWAASSTEQDRLNGDFACHDGGSGDPVSDDIASDPAAPDPDVDPGIDPDDPGDPGGPGDRQLEGGGGCAASGADGGAPFALLALMTLLTLLRARVASPSIARPGRSGTTGTGPRSGS